MGIETIHWHTLHPRYLNARSRVLDLGANYGRFSQAIVSRFGCRCVAVEASPEIYDQMPVCEGMDKFHLAIAATNGEVQFHVSKQSTASSMVSVPDGHAETVVVEGQTLESFVSELGWDGVDLLKVDIEGAEIGMLRSCSDKFLQSILQITIEFHDFCGITPRNEVREAIRRLESLGFFWVRMSRVGHQDTWLINRLRCDISLPACWWARYVVRNWNGFRRMLARGMGRWARK